MKVFSILPGFPSLEWVSSHRAQSAHRLFLARCLFSYPDLRHRFSLFLTAKLFPGRIYRESLEAAVLEVEISGRIVKYNRKQASTLRRPVREVPWFFSQPGVIHHIRPCTPGLGN